MPATNTTATTYLQRLMRGMRLHLQLDGSATRRCYICPGTLLVRVHDERLWVTCDNPDCDRTELERAVAWVHERTFDAILAGDALQHLRKGRQLVRSRYVEQHYRKAS
jgi:hypothetical protein